MSTPIPPQEELIQPSNPPKDPTIALILSFFLAGGAGQIYLGQTIKGIAIIAATVLTSWFGVGVLVWILGIVDAYQIANRLKEGKPVKQWEFFWTK